MTLLDLLCSIHDQQYIKIIQTQGLFPSMYHIDGTAAYVLRAFDFNFYMQTVKSITPISFNNKIALEITCM